MHYRYPPSVLAREPDFEAETVYLAGGLYGNPFALERLLELAHDESVRAVVVFNGDFHWFDVNCSDFVAIDFVVMQHIALRGNVETEIASDEPGAGCGCAYPDGVSDAEVDRSNAIISRLRDTGRVLPARRTRLGVLPMHVVTKVAGVRVAIVHGDAESLSGWSYSAHALSTPDGVHRLRAHFAAARVRIIASSHTCLPVALSIDTVAGRCALFNNGAAGMPNFRGTRYGVVTRISSRPSRHALYRARVGTATVEAVALDYNDKRWIEAFLDSWPAGSPAHVSYFERLCKGPAYGLASAVRGGVVLGTAGQSTNAARRSAPCAKAD